MLRLLVLAAALAAASPPTDQPVSYAGSVAPVLARRCVRCHGPTDQNGGLRLDSYEALARGGDSGPAIRPGDAQGSLLIQKIEHRDRPVMPPRKRLPPGTIATLREWIDRGARP